MNKQGFALALLLLLSGCATVTDWTDRHPVTAAVIAATLISSATISLESHGHGDRRAHDLTIHDPTAPACYTQPNGSCR